MRTPPAHGGPGEVDLFLLRRCLDLAEQARRRGDDPFGSLLADAGGAVLAEARNAVRTERDVTAHPELLMVRWASQHLSEDECAAVSLYTSGEPCPMCAAGCYWAGLGRVVFALSNEQLRSLAPSGAVMLNLSSAAVFAHGRRHITVVGPVAAVSAEARAVVDGSRAAHQPSRPCHRRHRRSSRPT